MKKQIFRQEEIKLEVINEEHSRKILAHSDNVMVVKAYFDTNAIGATHSHMHDQITYCLTGEFEYYLGDETFKIGPGDSVIVHGHQEHGLKCLKEGVLLDIFSPARKDFLGEE